MFEDWKRAWQEAVENFRRELEGEGDGSGPAGRIRAMERGVSATRDALTRLDGELAEAERAASGERESEAVCRRRESLAEGVGDEETVRIAREYAQRHAERAAVLERKAEVLRDERALLVRDLESMEGVLADQPRPAAATGPSVRERLEERERADRDFRRLDQEARERMAAERLEELKRKLR